MLFPNLVRNFFLLFAPNPHAILSLDAENGFLWEEGPNSFQPNPFILKLAKDLDLLDELVLSDPSAPRFVYWNDELQALPSSISDLLTFRLLSFTGQFRAASGALGFINLKPKDKEESVKEFFVRHLGKFYM